MWQPINTAPKDGGLFIAIGDSDMASVWYEPEGGQRWKIRDIPLGGVYLGTNLAIQFHSWCRANDLHRLLNTQLHPEYYMTGAEILTLEKLGKTSPVHKIRTGG